MSQLAKTALDQGFIQKCAEYGITDDHTIGSLMKMAADEEINRVNSDITKQASYANPQQEEMQKQANLKSAASPLDAGFIGRCHQFGVTNPNDIQGLMKVAYHLLEQEIVN